MRKNLLIVISAVLCGVLAMLIPLYVFLQLNYPEGALTISSLRRKTLEFTKTQHFEHVTFFYSFLLTLSFTVALIFYVISRKNM